MYNAREQWPVECPVRVLPRQRGSQIPPIIFSKPLRSAG